MQKYYNNYLSKIHAAVAQLAEQETLYNIRSFSREITIEKPANSAKAKQ